ncbi:hypothetical protein FPSM_00687 [Flavobacterium psychrophilum]|nr:hypothetical protein FPSM_00687 [Flavobacterium psychrophilum]
MQLKTYNFKILFIAKLSVINQIGFLILHKI